MKRHPTPLSLQSDNSNLDDVSKICCCHVRTFSFIISVLEFIVLIICSGILIDDLMSLMRNETRNSKTSFRTLTSLIGLIGDVIWLIVIPVMVYGVKYGRHFLLIPHLILQIMAIVGFCIRGLFLVTIGMVPKGWTSETDTAEPSGYMAVGTGVCFLLGALIESFFVHVIMMCYAFLAREKTQEKQKKLVT